MENGKRSNIVGLFPKGISRRDALKTGAGIFIAGGLNTSFLRYAHAATPAIISEAIHLGMYVSLYTARQKKLFEKHGIINVGYWVTDVGESNHELTYMLAFEDANQRVDAWTNFRNDPEWVAASEESHRDGLIVKNVRNQTLIPTPYSPMQ